MASIRAKSGRAVYVLFTAAHTQVPRLLIYCPWQRLYEQILKYLLSGPLQKKKKLPTPGRDSLHFLSTWPARGLWQSTPLKSFLDKEDIYKHIPRSQPHHSLLPPNADLPQLEAAFLQFLHYHFCLYPFTHGPQSKPLVEPTYGVMYFLAYVNHWFLSPMSQQDLEACRIKD